MKKFISKFVAVTLLLTMIPMGQVFAETRATKVSEIKTVPTIGKLDGQKAAEIIFREYDRESWVASETFVLRLPDGITWNKDTKVNNKTVTKEQISGRDLTIKMDTTKSIDEIIILPVIDVDRKVDFGNVELSLDRGPFNKDETRLTIAKVSDYGMKISVPSVRNFIYGETQVKEIDVDLEEMVDGSLAGGTMLELVLENAKFDESKAPVVKMSSGKKELKATYSQGAIKLTSDSKETKTKWRITFDIKPEKDFSGDVKLKLMGRGVEDTLVIASVEQNTKVSVTPLKDVVLGLQDQPVSDIVITESKAGALVTGDYTVKIIPEHKSFKIASGKLEVTEGNLEASDLKFEDGKMTFRVSKISSRPAVLRIKDMKVSLGRDVYMGKYKAEILLNAGKANQAKFGEVELLNAILEKAPARKAQFIVGQTAYDVIVDGRRVTNQFDVAPYIDAEASRTMMSVRAVAEAMNMNVEYVAETSTVIITSEKEGKKDVVKFIVGKNQAFKNDALHPIDVAPVIKNDRAFIPVAYVADLMGAKAEWDNEARMVTIIQE